MARRLLCLLAALCSASLHAQDAVEVVAPTPVPGLGVPRDQLPANVQVLPGRAIGDAEPVSVPDLMVRRLQGISVNEVQGNPFQPDVTFRGFSASPLLGTPQGLSVFLDGA